MAIRCGFAVLAGTVVMLALTGAHGWLLAAECGAVVLIAARAVRVRRNRAVWTLAAVGIAQWVLGGVAWELGLETLSVVFYAGMFVCEYAGLSVFLRGRIRPFPVWLAVDGVLAAFALAALAVLAYGPLRAATGGQAEIVAAVLANLVCDLLLLALVLVGFAATAWRPGRAWWAAGAGLAVCAAGDVLAVFAGASRAVETLWAGSVLLVAVAAWQPTPPPTRTGVGWSTAVLPLASATVAVATVLLCGVAGGHPLAAAMASAALLAALCRAVLMLRENFRLLRAARREAVTDKLTGLANRRALLADLERALAGRRAHTLAFFDLDGFKAYNDTHGHAAGDALLQRLAGRLAAVGRAYRLGGDEFCLLGAPDPARGVAALTEGEVTASHGTVSLPGEAASAVEALRLADERMYACKRHRRADRADVLLRMLGEHGLDERRAAQFVAEFSGAS